MIVDQKNDPPGDKNHDIFQQNIRHIFYDIDLGVGAPDNIWYYVANSYHLNVIRILKV